MSHINYSTPPITMNGNNSQARRLLIIFSSIFLVDVLLMGSGSWANYLGVPVRKISFFGMALLATWLTFTSKRATKRMLLYSVSIISIQTAFTLVALLNGTPINAALSDGAFLFGMAFIPYVATAIIEVNAQRTIRLVVVISIYILAGFHIFLSTWGNQYPDDGPLVVLFAATILDPVSALSLESSSELNIGWTENGFRVYWTSSFFLLTGFFYAALFPPKNGNRFVLFTLCTAGLLATQTRGMYGALILLAVVYIAGIAWKRFPQALKSAHFTMIALILASMTLPAVVLADPSLMSKLGFDRGVGDIVRIQQIDCLTNAFTDNMLFGKGFGSSCVWVIRNDLAPWSYEMSILALYMKVGLVGITALAGSFVALCTTVKTNVEDPESKQRILILIGILAGIIFASNTNPYLFSLSGVGIFIILFLEFRLTSLNPNSATKRNVHTPLTEAHHIQ